jgi:hypothetical protein
MRSTTMETRPPFSLMSGGPLSRLLLRHLRVADPAFDGQARRRLVALVVAVTWFPLVAMALAARLATGRFPPLFADFAVHARLLLGSPLLIIAEQVLAMRTGRCLERFTEGRFAEEGPEAVERVAAAAARRGNALLPELLCALLALTGSVLVLRGMAQDAGLLRGRALTTTSPMLMAWYGLVGLPLYQFLLYRWLWRWGIWSRMLWSLSRLHLRPLATHPDRRGGLALLAEPSVGFSLVVLAVCVVQAAVWADHVVFAGAGLAEVRGPLGGLLVISLAVTFGPLLPFAPALWRARFTAVRQYDQLTLDLARLFHARWVQRGEREGLLGAPDPSSVIDLDSVYQIIGETRLVPFGLREAIPVVAAVLLPMLPVALLRLPLAEVIRKLGSIAVGGGIPG